VALEDGEVTHISKTYTKCKDGWGAGGIERQAGAVYVYHPDLGVGILYGEIDADKIAVTKGQKVQKGEYLGIASFCGMLHMEIQKSITPDFTKWNPPSGQSSSGNNKCAKEYQYTKPTTLLNPVATVEKIKDNFCG